MISFKQAIIMTEVFHFKMPHLGLPFMPLISFEIIYAIFPHIDWPLISDYSSLIWIGICYGYGQKQPPELLYKRTFLEISQNSLENICAKPQACNFIKKETLVFSCKFCEVSKNTFFTEHLWMAASAWK